MVSLLGHNPIISQGRYVNTFISNRRKYTFINRVFVSQNLSKLSVKQIFLKIIFDIVPK